MKRVLDGASMFYVGLFFVVILLGGVHIYCCCCYYYYYWTAVVLLIFVDAKGAPRKAIELEVRRCRRPLPQHGASYDALDLVEQYYYYSEVEPWVAMDRVFVQAAHCYYCCCL